MSPLAVLYIDEQVPGMLGDDLARQLIRTSDELSDYYGSKSISFRSDPFVVDAVDQLGELSYGRHSELKIVEVPDGLDLEITDYDGIEIIEEKHRIWR